ncbi:hypothetical protein D3C78_1165950 [compost metagenome]
MKGVAHGVTNVVFVLGDPAHQVDAAVSRGLGMNVELLTGLRAASASLIQV